MFYYVLWRYLCNFNSKIDKGLFQKFWVKMECTHPKNYFTMVYWGENSNENKTYKIINTIIKQILYFWFFI